MSIALVFQSRSSDLPSTVAQIQKRHKASTVFSTNVAYSDDPEMRSRLDLRKTYYEGRHPTGFVPATHSLCESLLNESKGLCFIDSWNLQISNLWLRGNSLPIDRVALQVVSEAEALASAIALGIEHGLAEKYVILTSDVSMDLAISTPDLETYLYLITLGNHALLTALQNLGQKVTAWYNGSVVVPMESMRG